MISHSPRSSASEGLERSELADLLESQWTRMPDLAFALGNAVYRSLACGDTDRFRTADAPLSRRGAALHGHQRRQCGGCIRVARRGMDHAGLLWAVAEVDVDLYTEVVNRIEVEVRVGI